MGVENKVAVVTGAAQDKLKALYIIGENPLVSDPDINHVEQALKNLDLLVVQDIFLSDTAEIADMADIFS